MTTSQKIGELVWNKLPQRLKEILADVVLKSAGATETVTVDGKILTFVNGQLTNVADE